MKYFSVPADFKKETIDGYRQLNEAYRDARVWETYGNITVDNCFESGRAVNQLPPIDLNHLRDWVAYSADNGIEFNYTLNASNMQNREFTENGNSEIKKFLIKLYDAGVRSLTIALPSLIELVRSMPLDFNIKASAICQITNTNKAVAYKRKGVQRIVVDESVNRDFAELKRIRNRFGEHVELIANSICFKNCIYRMFHYNQISHDSVHFSSKTGFEYYSHRCIYQRHEQTSNLLRLNWIRPEDIKYYTAIGIRYFKLQGRQTVVNGDPLKAVESYFKESYDGDLMELLDLFDPTNSFRVHIDNKKLEGFIKSFYENESFCKNDCESCQYCESFAKKAIDYKEAGKTIHLANEFYKEYDPYSRLLEKRNAHEPVKKLFEDDAVDGANFTFED